MSAIVAPRWLIVVNAERKDLHRGFERRFGDATFVEVMLDRRRHDRRSGSVRALRERRQADRRRDPGARELSPDADYRLIQEGNGFRILQAVGRMPVRCSDCPTLLEFDLPRFSEPPARMSVSVIHARQPGGATQHSVEVQAFKATGSCLVACRIFARRSMAGALLNRQRVELAVG